MQQLQLVITTTIQTRDNIILHDILHADTNLFMKSFWNNNAKKKLQSLMNHIDPELHTTTFLLSFGLLLVILQMSSEIPFVGIIFRVHVTLETGMVDTAPLDVIKIGSTMSEFFAT